MHKEKSMYEWAYATNAEEVERDGAPIRVADVPAVPLPVGSIRHSNAGAKWRLGADGMWRLVGSDRRPRIFTFANGCEIDVDRYLGLDATATRDGGTRPSITFQLGHGGFLRVVFESEQQRADELARMRAFRDGVS